MLAAGHQPFFSLLPASQDLPGEPGVKEPGLRCQPETSPASEGNHGAQGHSPAPQDAQPAPGHQVYPYLLRGVAITQPNQVWTSDLPTFPWLRASCMDWYSRYVLAWRLSNTLEAGFCVEALEEALRKGVPEIFNADQGAQFTSQACTALLEQHGVRVSMDGKGRYTDNLFIERLWRSLKYEEVYLKAYAGGKEARAGIGGYFSTTWSNPIRLWVTKPQQRCL
jgi:putative transposase